MDDIFGKRYGHLTVIGEGTIHSKQRKVLCICDCGKETCVFASNLKRGLTKSCGCKRKGPRDNRSVLPEDKRLHTIWSNMKTRCDNPNVRAYQYYGGRGIKYCEQWEKWLPFKEWALSHGYREDLTIDRIDVNGDYCPENCHWVTKEEQMNNKRNNRIVEYNGESKTVAQWAKTLGIDNRAMWDRLFKQNMPKEKALTMPKRVRKGGTN